MLALFTALIMALSLWTAAPLTASADAGSASDLTYTETGGNATITGYTGADKTTMTSIEIPATVGEQDYPVTAISGAAFNGCTALTEITLGAGQNNFSVEDGVLFNADKTTILRYPEGKPGTYYQIPNTVTTIGANAFAYDKMLTSVSIPNGVTTIDPNAFRNNPSLTSMVIPASVTSISANAFYQCTALSSLTLSEGLLSIGEQAFYYCNSLTSVGIPATVTIIATGAFFGCASLTSVAIPASVETISTNSFRDCTSLTSVTIPEGVEIIDQNSFQNCGSLISVTIPSSVTSIKSNAFNGCAALETVVIKSSAATSIGTSVFQGCISLTSVTVPSSVTSMGTNVFNGCTSLTSAVISATINNVPSSTFVGCISLTSVTLPENMTGSIGGSTFLNCRSLTSITIPVGVATIPTGTFNNCSALTDIVIRGTATNFSNTLAPFTGTAPNKIWVYSSMPNNWIRSYANTNGILGFLLTSISVDGTLALNAGASKTLDVSYLPNDVKTEPRVIEWSSSNDEIATVDENGNVSGVSAGSATITATATSLSGLPLTPATCSVTVSAAPDNSITSFKIGEHEGTITDDAASPTTKGAITVTVPYGTNITNVTPQITKDADATVSPTDAQTFENGVGKEYTVTPNGGSAKTYTVTVTVLPAPKDVTSFTLSGVPGIITDDAADPSKGNIAVMLPTGTDITNPLTPQMSVSDGASVNKSGAQDFTSDVAYTVTGADALTKVYTVRVTVTPSSAKDITEFTLADVDGSINGSVIMVTFPYGTPVTSLIPVIVHSSTKATDPVTPVVAQNFNANIKYTVTAEDGTKKAYTVVVKFTPPLTERDIVSFKIGSAIGDISGTDIGVTVPYGTSVAALEPEITVSDKASVTPASGTPQDFTDPVTYTVKAQNGTLQTYTVTVTVAPPPPPSTQTYAVTVTGGSGSASYAEGDTVNITANAPADGKIFDTWTTSDGVTFADPNSSTTSFTMPANAVTVTATYKDEPKDSDGDGVPDYVEEQEGTDLNDPCDFKDTDEDGVPDYVEIRDGTDPADPSSFKDVNGDGIPDYVQEHPEPVTGTNGWVYGDGAWKFFVDSVAQTGWVYNQNKWYYLNADGIMQTGWLYDQNDKAWYYLAGNGAMKVGWVKDDGSWYYLSGNGAMVAAKWLHDTDGSWYYLSGNGKMLTGKQKIGAKTYSFKANGAWAS
jgi:hypothetical protein